MHNEIFEPTCKSQGIFTNSCNTIKKYAPSNNYFNYEILSNMMLKLCRFQNLEKLKINCREPVLNSVQQELLGKLIVTNFRKLKDIDISLYLQDGPDSIEQLPYEEAYAKFLDEIRNLPNLVSLTLVVRLFL
mgnify:CR=1 FL=1